MVQHHCFIHQVQLGLNCEEWEVYYIPFHSSDSNLLSILILDSVTRHPYYASHIFSLSSNITFLLHLFTLVSDWKSDTRL